MKRLLVYLHGFGGGESASSLGEAISDRFSVAKGVDIWMPRWEAGNPKISAWITFLELIARIVTEGSSGALRETIKIAGGASRIENSFVDAQSVGKIFGATLGMKVLPAKLKKERYDEFSLIGFSLGTECTINALATLPRDLFRSLRNVVLCGGTVDSKLGILGNRKVYLKGKVFNFYSSDDRILQFLFQKVSESSWKPAGLYPLEDASFGKSFRLGVGHMGYPKALPTVIAKSHLSEWLHSI